jgi:hypothetical protein
MQATARPPLPYSHPPTPIGSDTHVGWGVLVCEQGIELVGGAVGGGDGPEGAGEKMRSEEDKEEKPKDLEGAGAGGQDSGELIGRGPVFWVRQGVTGSAAVASTSGRRVLHTARRPASESSPPLPADCLLNCDNLGPPRSPISLPLLFPSTARHFAAYAQQQQDPGPEGVRIQDGVLGVDVRSGG